MGVKSGLEGGGRETEMEIDSFSAFSYIRSLGQQVLPQDSVMFATLFRCLRLPCLCLTTYVTYRITIIFDALFKDKERCEGKCRDTCSLA